MTARIWIALSALLMVAAPAKASPVLAAAPTLVPNPNAAVPLAAVLKFVPTEAVTTEVKIEEVLAGSSTRYWSLNFPATADPAAGLPLIGFRGGGEARIFVVIRNLKGEVVSTPEPLTFKAPPLPPVGPGWPLVTPTLTKGATLEPGVTILSVRRRAPGRQAWQSSAQQRFARRYGLLIGLDSTGVPVWYYKSDTRIAGVQTLPDGKVMMTLQDQRSRIIDMLGNTITEFVAEFAPEAKSSLGARVVKGIDTLHHEPYPSSRGTFFSMSAKPVMIDNYFTSVTDPNAPRKRQQVMGDTLVEFDRDGKIIWEWSAFDHLDTNRIHYALFQPYWKVRGFPEALDWTHGNGLTFDESSKTLVMTFKHLDAVIGVAYPSGQIRWILGDPKGWPGAMANKVLKPKGAFVRYPFSPHHPHITPQGTVTYYDNGMFQAFPFDGRPLIPASANWSRGVEVKIDLKTMTFEEVWTSESTLGSDSCYNWAMGETLRLPVTGNMMAIRSFCPPRDPTLSDVDEYDLSKRFVDDVYYAGRVDQYTRTNPAQLVARYALSDPNELVQWQIYGGVHVGSLYFGDTARASATGGK